MSINDRIYQSDDGQWYYRIRGNQIVGPFESRAEAQDKLSRQVRLWTGRAGPLGSWPRQWHPRFFRRSATRQT